MWMTAFAMFGDSGSLGGVPCIGLQREGCFLLAHTYEHYLSI